jgi:hypothetical protein
MRPLKSIDYLRTSRVSRYDLISFDSGSLAVDGHIEWYPPFHGLNDFQSSGVADLEGIRARYGFSGL